MEYLGIDRAHWNRLVCLDIDQGHLACIHEFGDIAFITTSQYAKLPSRFQTWLPYMLGGVVCLLGLLANEMVNCKRMMESYKFPYHILVEIVGLALFVALAILFLEWDQI